MIETRCSGRLSRYCLALSLMAAAQGQILQNRSALCGKPGETVPLPEGTVFSPDPGGFSGKLVLKLSNGSTKAVNLGLAFQVLQVCPISQSRLLVFYSVPRDGPFVSVISQRDGTEIEGIGSRDPVVSPDQHWIVYREYYPARAVISTEAYMLYDLTKDPVANRPPGWDPKGARDFGRQIYSVTADGFARNSDEEVEPTHSFTSDSFYWSSDSRFVAFADDDHNGEVIVIVRMSERGPTTYVHHLAANELCEGTTDSAPLPESARLDNVEFISTASSGWELWAHFSHIPCHQPTPQPLRFRSSDFKPAAVEIHKKIRSPGK